MKIKLELYNLCFLKNDLKTGEEAVEEGVKVHPAFDNVWSPGKLSLYESSPEQLGTESQLKV